MTNSPHLYGEGNPMQLSAISDPGHSLQHLRHCVVSAVFALLHLTLPLPPPCRFYLLLSAFPQSTRQPQNTKPMPQMPLLAQAVFHEASLSISACQHYATSPRPMLSPPESVPPAQHVDTTPSSSPPPQHSHTITVALPRLCLEL